MNSINPSYEFLTKEQLEWEIEELATLSVDTKDRQVKVKALSTIRHLRQILKTV